MCCEDASSAISLLLAALVSGGSHQRIGILNGLSAPAAMPHKSLVAIPPTDRDGQSALHPGARPGLNPSSVPNGAFDTTTYSTARCSLAESKSEQRLLRRCARPKRNRRRGLVTPFPPVREYPLDQLRLLQAPAAARVLLNLDPKHSLEAPRPVRPNVFRTRGSGAKRSCDPAPLPAGVMAARQLACAANTP